MRCRRLAHRAKKNRRLRWLVLRKSATWVFLGLMQHAFGHAQASTARVGAHLHCRSHSGELAPRLAYAARAALPPTWSRPGRRSTGSTAFGHRALPPRGDRNQPNLGDQ